MRSSESKHKGIINISYVDSRDKQENMWLIPASFVCISYLFLMLPVFKAALIRSDIIAGNVPVIGIVTFLVPAALTTLFMLAKNFKHKAIGIMGSLVLCALISLIFKKAFKSGILTYINCILVNRNYEAGEIALFYDPEKAQTGLCLSLCLIIAAVLIAAIILILSEFKLYIVLMIWPVVLMWASSIACAGVNVPAASAVVCAISMTIIISGNAKGTVIGIRTLWPILLGIVVIISAGAVVAAGSSGSVLEKAKSALEAGLERSFYGEADLTDGDFTGIKERRVSDEVLLKLSDNIASDTYLKGFVGASYNGHGFEDLDKAAYSGANLKMFQWLSESEGEYVFSPLTGLSYALNNSIGVVKGENKLIKVTNTGAFGKYCYVPYSVNAVNKGEDKASANVLFNKDLNVKNSLLSADNRYDFEMYNTQLSNSQLIAAHLDDDWYNLNYLIDNHSYYVQREQNYADFVKENYLDVPAELEDYLAGQNLRKESGIFNVTWVIRAFLADRLTYNESPISTYSGRDDFVINLLDRDREGYGVHFAAAAVMLFRYYGIPARYVEGFITDGSKEVKRSDCHAWAEVYMDGIGWIPAEVTPGMYKEDVQLNEFMPLSGDEEAEDIEGNSGDNAENGGSKNKINCWSVVIIILIFVLIAALFMLRRKLILRYRKRKIADKNISAAIAYMSALVIRWARLAGIKIRKDFPMEDQEKMNECFPIFAGNGYNIMVGAVEHSLYSENGANEEDRKVIEVYVKLAARQLYESAGAVKKLKLKYIDVII